MLPLTLTCFVTSFVLNRTWEKPSMQSNDNLKDVYIFNRNGNVNRNNFISNIQFGKDEYIYQTLQDAEMYDCTMSGTEDGMVLTSMIYDPKDKTYQTLFCRVRGYTISLDEIGKYQAGENFHISNEGETITRFDGKTFQTNLVTYNKDDSDNLIILTYIFLFLITMVFCLSYITISAWYTARRCMKGDLYYDGVPVDTEDGCKSI